MATLRQRGELLADFRTFLMRRGYWEVETPLLSHDCCVDAHLDPFETSFAADARLSPFTGDRLYLQTSPEFAMKRLLASASGSIFQITKSFRQGERGGLHNPEFTIAEWYRVGGSYTELMTELDALYRDLAGTPPAKWTTYREAFRLHAGFDPFETTDDELKQRAFALGFHGSSRDDLLNFLLAALVEPQLGIGGPEFLFDYPATQAALSRVRKGPPDVAERFELYVSGIEHANGFQELTDAQELRRRNSEQNRLRQLNGKSVLPIESRLLSAMDSGLPDAAGVALGFDRFVMLALGKQRIDEVMPFPLERA